MISVEVVEKFSLKAFDEIKNLKRLNESRSRKGELYIGDTFDCDETMCDYLMGNNPLKKAVVKVVEVKPEKVIPLTDNEEPEVFIGYSQVIEEQPKKKTTRKKK